MHQPFEIPVPSVRSWAWHSNFMQVKASEVSGPLGQKWVVHSPAVTVPRAHGNPFVKQLCPA